MEPEFAERSLPMSTFARSIRLKERLHAGGIAIGAWLTFSCAAASEILAGVGFDWLVIDTEHAPFSLEHLERTLMALDGGSAAPIVRVPSNDRVIIKQALDLGAEGVLVPDVGSPEDAQQAVAACKYPPEGVRGFGPRRASDYYRRTEEYIQSANTGVFIAIQIEHARALAALRQILVVPGIDVVVVGPMDLSASLGLLGQLDHPAVVGAIEQVIEEASLAGIPVCVPLGKPPEELLGWADRGCRFIRAGTDHVLLRQAATRMLETFQHQMADFVPSWGSEV
jgi:2-keto-3-deoxy-L-rhamnonate aldolase RhmA